MRRFRKCLWCGQYSLVPCVDDFIEETRRCVEKEMGERANTEGVIALAGSTRLLAEGKLKCSFCNEAFFDNFLEKSQYEERGYALYEEYKKFMKGMPLPEKVKIEVVKSNKFGGECRYDKDLNMFIVSLNEDTCFNPYDIKPIFYHEFTHVLDLYDPVTGDEIEDRNKNKWYSEYHASEIEMMARLGYKSINHTKNINLSSKIVHNYKTISLENYFHCIIKEHLDFIKKQHNKGMLNESIVRAIVYNLGKINFCIKHIDDELIKYIPNMNEIYNYVKTILIDDDFVDGFDEYINIINNNIDDISNEIKDGIIDNIIIKIWHLLSFNMSKNKNELAMYKYKAFNKITGWLKEISLDILEKSKEDK